MVSKADQEAGATALRANIRRLLAAHGMTQRALGAAAGMENPDQTVSDFLAGRAKQLDYSYLGPMARVFGCSMGDLFTIPVQQNKGGASPVTGADLDSAHGRAVDSTRVLQQQLAEVTRDNAALRKAISRFGRELVELGAMGKQTQRAAKSKP